MCSPMCLESVSIYNHLSSVTQECFMGILCYWDMEFVITYIGISGPWSLIFGFRIKLSLISFFLLLFACFFKNVDKSDYTTLFSSV